MSFIDIAKQAANVQGAIAGAVGIVDAITSMFGVDVVGLFDNDNFEQILQTARPTKADIIRQQKIMDHPIETGAIVSDFAILLPVVVELQMLLTGEEYQSIYQDIKAYYATRTFIVVQTKADTFGNMIIESMPSEETVDMFDAIPLTLRLREIQLVTVQYQALPPKAVEDPKDQSTVNAGVQQPKTSILYDIKTAITNLF